MTERAVDALIVDTSEMLDHFKHPARTERRRFRCGEGAAASP